MENMKRYFIFAYDTFYPEGGMNDYQASFDSLEDAKEYTKTLTGYDYIEIWDMEKMEEIEEIKI